MYAFPFVGVEANVSNALLSVASWAIVAFASAVIGS